MMTRPLRLALAFGLVLAACEEEPSLSDGGTAPTDLGGGDFGVFEMGTSDLGTEDVASTDLGPGDVGPQDHGPTDLGYADLGAEDAGPADLGTEPGVLALVLDGQDVRPGLDALDFGRIVIGSIGTELELTLVNRGTGPLAVRSATVSSPDFAVLDFSPVTLAVGTSTSFSVGFVPSASGAISATLELSSDDPSLPMGQWSLQGEGVRPEDLPADTNGTWTSTTFIAYDTRESRIVVRVGDIDNLGFGFATGFDPFSGASTRAHRYPFTPDAHDPSATDRIMVPTSYAGGTPRDGYSQTTSRPDNLPEGLSMQFDLRGSVPRSAVLQLFVDDFQAPVWGSSFEATLDGRSAPFITLVLNTLSQTGPIGKLITLPFPPDMVDLLDDGRLELFIDDTTTTRGDGFALDFAKLFIDVYGFTNVGSLSGTITDATTGNPIAGANVSASGFVSTRSVADGSYALGGVPAGYVFLQVSAVGYQSSETLVDLQSAQALTRNVSLTPL